MTERELIEEANKVLEEINQPLLVPQEERLLWCRPHDTEQEFFDGLAWVLNKRGGQGDAVDRLKCYASLLGVTIGVTKQVKNNVFLGAVLR